MKRELKNCRITHVSYVGKAANKKKFFFTKAEDDRLNIQKQTRIFTKADDEQQLVYGIVYEPYDGSEKTIDSHGHFMTAAEIEKAAHGFLKDARNIDKQHDFQAGVGEVVESYIAQTDFTMGGETITKGSWVLVTKASDDIWKQIKKGKITGYSMAGVAEIEEVAKAKLQDTMKSFFQMVKSVFTSEKTPKGALGDTFPSDKKRLEMSDAMNLFEQAKEFIKNKEELKMREEELKVEELQAEELQAEESQIAEETTVEAEQTEEEQTEEENQVAEEPTAEEAPEQTEEENQVAEEPTVEEAPEQTEEEDQVAEEPTAEATESRH